MLQTYLFFHPQLTTLILHLTGEMLHFLVVLFRKGNTEYYKLITWTNLLFKVLYSGVLV